MSIKINNLNPNWINEFSAMQNIVKKYNSISKKDRSNCWHYLQDKSEVLLQEIPFSNDTAHIAYFLQAVPEWCDYYDEIDALSDTEITTLVKEYYGTSTCPQNTFEAFQSDLSIKLVKIDYNLQEIISESMEVNMSNIKRFLNSINSEKL